MSFSNILSEDRKTPPPASPSSTRKSLHSTILNNHHSPEVSTASIPPIQSPSKTRHTSVHRSPAEPQARPRSTSQRQHSRKASAADRQKAQVAAPPVAPTKPKIVVNNKEYQAALNKIDSMDLSEPDDVGFEEQRKKYKNRIVKRVRSVEDLEAQKRKVCI